MDAVFHALAHPARRQMLDLVRHEPGSTVGEVCGQFEMSRVGAMKHLQILEDADLVTSRADGRRRLLYANAIPIQMIYDRWISDWSSLWAQEITGLKYRVEQAAAKEPDEVTIDG
jgi:DNA-binding transcriptional ArsR family regulator